jgi:hypothetical protein
VLYSLLEEGGLEPHGVAKRFNERFSETGDYGPLPQDGLYNGSKQHVRELPIEGPWRHISIAGFLKNIRSGRKFPKSGTDDAQADCFLRVVPVIALYAGHPDMLHRVEEVVRVTQDNPPSIAVAQAFARILESIIVHGKKGLESIKGAIEEFGHMSSELEGFYGRVSKTMASCVDLSGSSLYDAALHFGGGSYSTSTVS